jgi:putative copper export protein
MLYRICVFAHVAAACVWVGGLAFFALVLVPVLRGSPGPKTLELVRAVGMRFRVVGWAAIGLLILTGIGNLLLRMPGSVLLRAEFWRANFGKLLALKLSLVLLMLLVSVAHDLIGARATALALAQPGSPPAIALRNRASRLGRLVALLALAILFVAVLLVRGSW